MKPVSLIHGGRMRGAECGKGPESTYNLRGEEPPIRLLCRNRASAEVTKEVAFS